MICRGWTWITKKGKELRPANLQVLQLTSSRLASSTSPNSRAPVTASISTELKGDFARDVARLVTDYRPVIDRLKMGYPCQVFHASELPERVQADLKGRKRKLESGVRNVDLTGCELLEMLQYKCEIKEPVKWDSPVQCYAVDRLFRK